MPPVHQRLAPGPTSVREARRSVRRELLQVGRTDLIDTGELLTSELVTNALLHVGTWIDLDIFASAERLQVHVTDASPHLPHVSAYSLSAGTGHGLRMLQTMADAWGAEPTEAGGKTVWFRVCSDHENDSPAARETVRSSTYEDHSPLLRVRLANVPLLLHWAWQEHASAILRDHLLASMGDHPVEAIEAHAAAAEALSILERAVPVPELPEGPDELLAATIEPGVTAREIIVVLPRASVSSFAQLDRSLDEALTQDDEGALLTARIQPELQELRRWICREVREQGSARAPRPWNPSEHADGSESLPLEWDASAVRNSASAIIAADDTDRIVAVSDAAAQLLGYPDPDSMAGLRLVSIIPTRFRQAHLAGFTMYFNTGRAPLMVGPVVLPALRHDGSETPVVLSLESHAVDNGRTVFTARLTAPTGQQPA